MPQSTAAKLLPRHLSYKILLFHYNSTCLLFPPCIVDRPSAPALTIVPSNTTVLRGNTVSLICSADANPDAHVYQFYFNDTSIGNSSSGVFSITVKADGMYTCVPINTVGTGHNATVSVTAVGKLVVKT